MPPTESPPSPPPLPSIKGAESQSAPEADRLISCSSLVRPTINYVAFVLHEYSPLPGMPSCVGRKKERGRCHGEVIDSGRPLLPATTLVRCMHVAVIQQSASRPSLGHTTGKTPGSARWLKGKIALQVGGVGRKTNPAEEISTSRNWEGREDAPGRVYA